MICILPENMEPRCNYTIIGVGWGGVGSGDAPVTGFSEKILNRPFWAQKLLILITLDPLERLF